MSKKYRRCTVECHQRISTPGIKALNADLLCALSEMGAEEILLSFGAAHSGNGFWQIIGHTSDELNHWPISYAYFELVANVHRPNPDIRPTLKRPFVSAPRMSEHIDLRGVAQVMKNAHHAGPP